MKHWDDEALCKFETLRILALAGAPLTYLHDGIWLAKNGLLCPHHVCGKHEATKASKVEDSSGKPLELQR